MAAAHTLFITQNAAIYQITFIRLRLAKKKIANKCKKKTIFATNNIDNSKNVEY